MKFAPLDTFSRLRMVSFGDAVSIALGRRRRSPSWAVGFGNPRSQQHGDGEILRSQ
jgi:hypothetical protein